MKRGRCPRCNNIITFDESRFQRGKSLVFVCSVCKKEFTLYANTDTIEPESDNKTGQNIPYTHNFGAIIVVENVFHYKQTLPLKLGDNTIGRYMKGSRTSIPIETSDPSMDINHCVLTVKCDKKGGFRYILRDGPSFTGTFVDNDLLAKGERREIYNGTLFTIGATTIILQTPENNLM